MSGIKRNERRRKHYKMLRDVGYDRETATKIKDYDLRTVEQMCKIKQNAMKNVNQIDEDVQKQMDLILKGKRKWLERND